MRAILIALAAVAILPQAAQAGGGGGGGAKRHPSIQVRNTTVLTSAVVINPSQELIDNPTVELFREEGGVFLNRGEQKKFRVQQGTNTVYVVVINDAEQSVAELSETVDVSRDSHIKIVIEEDVAGTIRLRVHSYDH